MKLLSAFKKVCMARLSRNLIFYTGFRIRRAYTDKHRGQDRQIDDGIKLLSVRIIFGITPRDPEIDSLDRALVKEISSKLTSNDLEEIKGVISLAGEFVPILKREVRKQGVDYKTVRLSSILRATHKINREGKRHYHYFKYLHTQKLNVSADSIGKFVALLAPLLFIGGVLRQFIFANMFKFSAEDVFYIGDYVSSSISTLVYAVAPLVAMLILGGLAHLADTGQDVITRNIQARKSRRDSLIYLILGTGLLLSFVIRSKEALLLVLPYIVVMILFQFLPRLLNRYFTNYLQLYVIVAFSLMFFANILSTSISTADKIMDPSAASAYQVEFVQAIQNSDQLRYVTSGSKYTVFYDPVHERSVLLRNELIQAIRPLR